MEEEDPGEAWRSPTKGLVLLPVAALRCPAEVNVILTQFF